MAGRIADRQAATVATAKIAQLSRLPKDWRRTLTLDNGKEFAAFHAVENALGLSVYFADPYSAWQSGANENANGLLQRFYPKGADFSTVSDEELAAVVHGINNRPRKCLGYRARFKVDQQALSAAVGKWTQ